MDKTIQHANDLLMLRGSSFLLSAYHVLLEREPDELGWKYYSDRLASGVTKQAVLVEIGTSSESREQTRRIDGLETIIANQTSLRARAVRFLFPWLRLEQATSSACFQLELMVEQVAELHNQLSAVREAMAKEKREESNPAGETSGASFLRPIAANFRPTASPDSTRILARLSAPLGPAQRN